MTAVHPPEFATQLVGSWCKPKWLCDHDKVYGKEGTWWRLPADDLPEAQDDSVRLAVFDQNRAGLTYATDGECRRQTFSGHFYYGTLYTGQAMYLSSKENWKEYFPGIRDYFIKNQAKDGSWTGDGVGETYGTAIALMTLQLPYGYMPILQR